MVKKKKPLGAIGPWAWSVEFVRGCNLSCWHCSVRTGQAGMVGTGEEDHSLSFMTMETWEQMCHVFAEATPYTRLELAQGGEPTLHPNLLEALSMVRDISPTTQAQVTTNGLTLLNGKYTFNDLFDAGAKSVYVDCYSPDAPKDAAKGAGWKLNQEEVRERHIELAEAAREIDPGIKWYYYYEPRKLASHEKHWMANTYYGDPAMRQIILQDTPEHRTRWRKGGRLSTFLNHVDWKESMPFGLVPVREPIERKCNMLSRYVSTDWKGNYLFCCIDFACETAGLLGNVSDGPKHFRDYWHGRLMQSMRRRLSVGDRKSVPYCSRCNCAFSRCDMRIWPEGSHDFYIDGGEKQALPSPELDDEVFADGWEKTALVNACLPTEAEELAALDASDRLIIHSAKAVAQKRQQKRLFPLDDE